MLEAYSNVPRRLGYRLCLAALLIVLFEPRVETRGIEYPYGGVQDSARFDSTWNRFDLNFENDVDFSGKPFDLAALMPRANFKGTARFDSASFGSFVVFFGADFQKEASFEQARFKDSVDFIGARFHSKVNFKLTRFDGGAIFQETVWKMGVESMWSEFHSNVSFQNAFFGGYCRNFGTRYHGATIFTGATFEGPADFQVVVFDSSAEFNNSVLTDAADFRYCEFHGDTHFKWALFGGAADFNDSKFYGKGDFYATTFLGKIDLRQVQCMSGAELYFDQATICDSLMVGTVHSSEIPVIDLSGCLFPSGGHTIKRKYWRNNSFVDTAFTKDNCSPKIILCGPVDMPLQLENFRYLSFDTSLSYPDKRKILGTLKHRTFAGDQYKKERLELDYIFAKSTKYKDKSWYKSVMTFLYDITLGLGYRPFKLVIFIALLIFAWGVCYFRWMRLPVSAFAIGDEPDKLTRAANFPGWRHFLNALHFSAASFLSIRLSRRLLRHFDNRQTKVVIAEWVTGLLAYLYFIIFSKAGSIGYTVAQIFTG